MRFANTMPIRPRSHRRHGHTQGAPSLVARPDEVARNNVIRIEPGSDWQASKHSMRERHAVMLNNDFMSDVTFIVGSGPSPCRIPAHKYMLSTGSSVFYAMFYGGLADRKNEIRIPDVEPLAFKTMLRYLYCDEISLDADYALHTLYAAKKYSMPHLEESCLKYLMSNVNANNACLLLSQSILFEKPDLMQRCLDFIDRQTVDVLRSDDFTEVELQIVEKILCRDSLGADETVILDAAIRWAEAELKRQNKDISPQNCRAVLGDAFFLIRFPTMTQREFADKVGPTGLLDAGEINDIFFYFSATTKPNLRFPTTRRKGVPRGYQSFPARPLVLSNYLYQ